MKTRSLWRAIQCHHLEVQLWCQTAIEAEFFLAEEVSLRQRREIDKAQIDGLFDLVRIRASQHHPRDVRLQDDYLGGRMLIYSTIGEGLDQMVVSVHGVTSSGANARFHCRAPR